MVPVGNFGSDSMNDECSRSQSQQAYDPPFRDMEKEKTLCAEHLFVVNTGIVIF